MRRIFVGRKAIAFYTSLTTRRSVANSNGLDDPDEDDDLVRQIMSNTPPDFIKSPPAASFRPPAPPSPASPESAVNAPPRSAESREKTSPAADESSCHSAVVEPEVAKATADFYRWSRSYTRARRIPSSDNGAVGSKFQLEWLCVVCMKYNSELVSRCVFCRADSWRSKKALFPPVTHRVSVPDSWWCARCKIVNTATPGQDMDPRTSRLHCYCSQCKGPFGSVRAWFCTQCNLLNPRAASTCEMCAQKRPVTWTCQSCTAKSCVFETKCADCGQARQVLSESMDHLVKCECCQELNGNSWELCSSCSHPLPTMQFVKAAVTNLAPSRKPGEVKTLPIPINPRSHSKTLPSRIRHVESSRNLSSIVLNASSSADKWLCPICFRDNQKFEAECSGCKYRQVTNESPRVSNRTPWNCLSCGGLNPTDSTTCTICGEMSPHRPAELPTAQPATPAVQVSPTMVNKSPSPLKPGEWRCHGCASSNSPLTRRCVKCNVLRVIAPGYWQCHKCFSVNKNSRNACVGCFTSQKPQDAAAVVKEQWTCLNCRAVNPQGSSACGSCKQTRPTWKCACPAEHSSDCVMCEKCGQKLDVSWRCSSCSRLNMADAVVCAHCNAAPEENWRCTECGANCSPGVTVCSICGKKKPISVMWCCAICRDWNFGRVCARCNSGKREGGRQSVSGHWDCGKCQTRNAARAELCKTCCGRRILSVLSLAVTCSQCHQLVDVGPSETCPNCQTSLAPNITSVLSVTIKFYDRTQKTSPRLRNPLEEGVQGKVAPGKSVEREESADLHLTTGGGSEPRDVDEDPGDDELLLSYLTPESTALVDDAAATVADQFWVCTLCSAKNSDGGTECIVCGVTKVEE